MSITSDLCINKGKHYGTSSYHMCERCCGNLVEGCADFKIKRKPEGLEGYSWPAISEINRIRLGGKK